MRTPVVARGRMYWIVSEILNPKPDDVPAVMWAYAYKNLSSRFRTKREALHWLRDNPGPNRLVTRYWVSPWGVR